MGNQITEMVFVLDKSGSMAGFEDDTVGGFNSMIARQRNVEGKAYVSTVLFSNRSNVIHDRIEINSVAPLTLDDYRVGGGTALLDAIGSTIEHISTVHKYARPEDVPEHTLFVITTDGMENASCTYGSEQVKQMIKQKTEEHGWEFIFLAANIDAVETAGNIGIRRERAMKFTQSHAGVRQNYEGVEKVMCCMRQDRSRFADMDIKDIMKEKENG